ncbi:hypothetical protein V8E36_006139 [Tilletia maclaganii]
MPSNSSATDAAREGEGGADPFSTGQQDSPELPVQSAARLRVARLTVLLGTLALVSFAFAPRGGGGSGKGDELVPGAGGLSRRGKNGGGGGGPLAAQLHPRRYGRFEVLSVHTVTSPSLVGRGDESGDGQHVLLRIRAKINPALLAALGEGGRTSSSTTEPDLRIVSVFLKEPALQIERAYTPLRRPGSSKALPRAAAAVQQYDDDDGQEDPREVIELLIKRYADGELSRYASSLRAGDVVELRGPVTTWDLGRDHGGAAAGAGTESARDIIMLVGGTGITTAHQLLHTALASSPPEGQGQTPRIQVLYAAPKPSSFLLLPELAQMQDRLLAKSGEAKGDDAATSSNNVVRLFAESLGRRGISNPAELDCDTRSTALLRAGIASPQSPLLKKDGGFNWLSTWFRRPSPHILGLPVSQGRITPESISRALQSRLSSSSSSSSSPRETPPVVLVCGPDAMVAALAGPKEQDGSGGQGELGGLLGRLKVPKENVFKL